MFFIFIFSSWLFGIEQKEIINTKNPQLTLICDYELVDSQGKNYGNGLQTVENNISNLA
ncbi:hypothetical protein [Poinsettia branch-inducing phytoplasma]|uniref:hypothetical protein n=1 Tax=Poinsettia branch-inducing phytoplasma TaxID=138647 RepID=UPI00035E1C86|nr:hypothetical protein [Poinsettia branch-inducing phytoplasma]